MENAEAGAYGGLAVLPWVPSNSDARFDIFVVRLIELMTRSGSDYRKSSGLARGQVFTREGHLVVSVVQEGLIRTAPKPS